MTQKLKALRRHVRLLPAVMVLGACLLAVKGFDFAVSARAEAAPAATGQAKAVQPKHNTATATATDHDSATSIDTDDGSSTAEVDVLTSLAKRRAKLDARAKALDMRANLLTAAEKRVDAKIADLKALKQQIQSLLGQRDEAERKQVAALVKVYASMKPRDAARIFNSLNQPVLLDVARHMKPDALAPIMAAMSPNQAKDLTVKLANRLQLPAKPDLPATTQMASAKAAPAPTAQPPAASAPAADPATAAPPPGG